MPFGIARCLWNRAPEQDGDKLGLAYEIKREIGKCDDVEVGYPTA
jgi:hypothetical protein